MKNVKLILLMVAIIMVAVFAVQNSAAISIRFFTLAFHVSQALIIIISTIVGVLIGLAISVLKNFRQSRDIKQAKQETNTMNVQLANAEKENSDLKLEMRHLQDEIEVLKQELRQYQEPIQKEEVKDFI